MACLLKSLIKNQTFLRPLHNPPQILSSSSIFVRTLTSSSNRVPPKPGNGRKLLSVLFEEAVGFRPRTEETEIESETNQLKKKLLELEKELIELKESESLQKINKPKIPKLKKMERRKSLYALFSGHEEMDKQETGREEDKERGERKEARVFRELSLEMVVFVKLLYEKGYFNKANFLPGTRLDMGSFDDPYARDYVKYAAEKFGKDHQEIAKWLSGSQLKKVALFGCPSLNRKTVFSAKRLRKFFEIQENTVCDKCVLNEKCKFPNQSVWKGDTNSLDLAVVLRVISLYALDLVHSKLVVPEDIHFAVNQLLKEVINLSQTISSNNL